MVRQHSLPLTTHSWLEALIPNPSVTEGYIKLRCSRNIVFSSWSRLKLLECTQNELCYGRGSAFRNQMKHDIEFRVPDGFSPLSGRGVLRPAVELSL